MNGGIGKVGTHRLKERENKYLVFYSDVNTLILQEAKDINMPPTCCHVNSSLTMLKHPFAFWFRFLASMSSTCFLKSSYHYEN